MNIFLTQSQLGNAKAFLLKQVIAAAAKAQDHQIVDNAEQTDVAIIFGKTLPNLTALQGKKVYLADPEQTLTAPEQTVQRALTEATDYVAPAGVSAPTADGGKNIVAVTACPTGVAHTFMSAEAIEAYGKKMGWNVRVETRGQVGAGNPITPEEVAAADLVFVAADIDVDLSKFKGKPMYRTSTGLALKKPNRNSAKLLRKPKFMTAAKQNPLPRIRPKGRKKAFINI